MSAPRIVAVAPGSAAARAGLAPGDEVLAIDGQVPRDVIAWQVLADGADPELEVRRGGVERTVALDKRAGEPLGAEVASALFDQVRTCDNHCEFCFIYQLPKGMRRSLYLKDDDYRLSFLYGNFTTLTRFTEADLERVLTERLSPLYVSIHATDPAVRSAMLRNRRGATSLRWLKALLDGGIEVHGQVVVCPGQNDGDVLHDTLAGVLDEYPALSTVGVVPLGVSRHSTEPGLRPHTPAEAAAVVDAVEWWQGVFTEALGHRMVHASDELYVVAGRDLPPLDAYDGLLQHENGIGMVRAFEAEFTGQRTPAGPASGFFQSVDGAPAEGYRAPRTGGTAVALRSRPQSGRAPVTILTGEYGARVLPALVGTTGRDDVTVAAVPNRWFGGNTAVAGLLTGADVAAALGAVAAGDRVLLPDVCLNQDRFLDDVAVSDLPRPVEVVATNGAALRRALAA